MVGTISLAIGLSAAMFLSVNLLSGTAWAAVVAGGVGAVTVVTWFGLPLYWTLRGD